MIAVITLQFECVCPHCKSKIVLVELRLVLVKNHYNYFYLFDYIYSLLDIIIVLFLYNMDPVKSRKSTRSKIISFIKNYFENCTVHGLKYINNKSNIRSFIWIVFCLIGLVFCFTLVFTLIGRFQKNYTQINFATSAFPVWEDPFPGVSICNNNIVHKNKTGKIIGML